MVGCAGCSCRVPQSAAAADLAHPPRLDGRTKLEGNSRVNVARMLKKKHRLARRAAADGVKGHDAAEQIATMRANDGYRYRLHPTKGWRRERDPNCFTIHGRLTPGGAL